MAPRNSAQTRAKRDDLYLQIGRKCREFRIAKNMTLIQLADEIGASASTLGNMEAGGSAPVWMLAELAEFYDITIDELIPT